MAKKPKYGTWVKNFGRSVQFSAKSVLTDMAPTMSETRENVQNDIHELRQQLQTNRNVKQALLNYLDPEGNVQKYAKEALKNTKQSLRTGKFYDARREDKAMGDAFGGDFDFDDFGSDSSDDLDFGSVSMGPDKVMDDLGPAMASFGESVGKGIGETNRNIARGFNALNEAEKGRMAMTMAINQKFYSSALQHLTAIEENSAAMVKFNNESMSVYVQGALKYYDDSLSIMKEIRDAVVPKKKDQKGFESDGLDDIFSGGFSLSGYINTVKKQFGNYMENSPVGMLSMLADPMFLASMAANPMSGLLSLGLGALVPSRLKKSIGRTDATFKEFLPALFDKLGRYSGNNEILGAMSEIFGVRRGRARDRFATNEYERGAIPYDGESKKAIVEVIPSYLSKILYTLEKMSGVANPAELVYDWSNDSETGGRFISRKTLQTRYDRNVRDKKLSGFSDARWELSDALGNLFGYGTNKTAQLKKEFDDMLVHLVDNDDKFNPKNIEFLRKFFGNKAGTMSQILQAMSMASQMSIAGSGRMDSRQALSKFYFDQMGNGSIANMGNYLAGRGNIYDLATNKNNRTWYNNDSRSGIYKDEDGNWKIDPKDLQALNKSRKFGNRFKSVDDVIAEYDRTHQKGTEGQYKDVITSLAAMTEPERQAYLKSKMAGTERDEDNRFSKSISNFFRKPLDFLDAGLAKIDNLMYKVIFDMDDDSNSVFKNVVTGIKTTFQKMNKWLEENIFNPIRDRIMGSKIMAKAKDGLKAFFIGDKDEQGRYKDGLFSGVLNGAQDVWGDIKKSWKEDVKPEIESLGGTIKEYIFGKDENADKKGEKEKKPIMASIMDKLSEGFNWWSSVLLGKGPEASEGDQKKSGTEMLNKFKGAMPKVTKAGIYGAIGGTISGLGGFGVLGSLFLPGGPIGGAIVGSAIGLLAQTDKFKELLFGKDEVDEKTGETKHIGGIISKDMQNFFKKNKVNIIGGAAIGTGSYLLTGSMAFGLMPGLAIGAFGPILAGAAMGVATRSEYFKNLLFGKEEKDEKGNVKRVGGIINAEVMGRIKKAIPRALVGALGSMAGFTVLGEMGAIGSMLALGPIPAAIAGAGIGILSASKNFTDSMFGYTDDNGDYHEGILGRMRNFFTLQIFKPLQLASKELFEKGSNWFKRNVALPIADAFIPIKVAAKKIGDNIIDSINKAMNQVGQGLKGVFMAIGKKTMDVFGKILNPLQRLGHILASGMSSALGLATSVALMPLKAAGGLANLYVRGSAAKKSLGLTAAMAIGGAWHNPFDFSDEYTKEIDDERARIREEKKKAKEERNALSDRYNKKWDTLSDEQKKARSNNYKSDVKRLAKVDEAINKSEDPQVVLAQAQLEEQTESKGYLKIISEKISNVFPGTKKDARSEDDNATEAHEKSEEEKRKEAESKFYEEGTEYFESGNGKRDKDSKKPEKKSSIFSMVSEVVSGVGSLLDFVGIGAGILGILGMIYSWISDDTDNPAVQEAMKNSTGYNRLQRHGAKVGSQIALGAYRVGEGVAGKVGRKIAQYKVNRAATDPKYAAKLSRKMEEKAINAYNKQVKTDIFAEKLKSGINRVLGDDGVLGKVAGKNALSTIRKFFNSMIDFFAKPDVFARIAKAIPGAKLLSAGLRTIGGTVTGGLLTAGFAVYDTITGLARTAELFDVADEDVDWTMRAVSTALNVILGLPYFVMFDAGMSALSLGAIAISGSPLGKVCEAMGLPLQDFDHHKILARIIYNYIVGDGVLEEKQAKKTEMEAKAKELINKDYENFMKNEGKGSNLTLDEYSKQRNSGVWNKYFAPTISKITGVDAYSIETNKPKSLLEMLQSPFQKVVDYFTGFAEKFENYGFLGMAKLILGLETNETLEEKKKAGQTHELSLWERFKYFMRGNRTEAEALRRAGAGYGFIGAGFEDEEGRFGPTTRDKVADSRDKSSLGYYYTQNDDRYADLQAAPNADASFGTIGNVGCAPTALSMVASMFNGYPISPVDVSKEVKQRDLYYGANALTGQLNRGIKSSFFGSTAPTYNLTMQQNIHNVDDMKRELLAGKALILGGQRLAGQTEYDSPFTKAGHYVVAKGYNPNRETVSIYDPLGKNTRSYNIRSLMASLQGANSFAASFSGVSGSAGGTNDPMALNPDVVKLPYSVQPETGEVNINALTRNAKEAMEYMAKYHRYLTGRNMIVSSGYRSTGTMGDHTTGNCFDVVDDANHRTLELNEDDIRTKMKQEAGRLGIKVLDEYIIDTPYKTAGHLHMDATNWLKQPYNNLSGIVDVAKNKIKTIMDFMGGLGKDFMSMAMATFAGRKYIPGKDGDGIPYTSTGGEDISPKEIYKYYHDKGYSDAAIAGILANIEAESSFNSSDRAEHKGDNGYTYGGVGLFQWNGARTEALKKWAAANGRDYTNPGTQLDYMMQEAAENSVTADDMEVFDNTEDGAASAAYYFADKFERCAEMHKEPRKNKARSWFGRIQSGEFAGAGLGTMTFAANKFAARNSITPLNFNSPANARRLSASSLSQNSIMRTAMAQSEMLTAIRSLDSHNELSRMIELLEALVEKDPVTVEGGIALSDKDRRNINQAAKRISSNKQLNRMIDNLDRNNTVPKDSLELAYQIARGGKYRDR